MSAVAAEKINGTNTCLEKKSNEEEEEHAKMDKEDKGQGHM